MDSGPLTAVSRSEDRDELQYRSASQLGGRNASSKSIVARRSRPSLFSTARQVRPQLRTPAETLPEKPRPRIPYSSTSPCPASISDHLGGHRGWNQRTCRAEVRARESADRVRHSDRPAGSHRSPPSLPTWTAPDLRSFGQPIPQRSTLTAQYTQICSTPVYLNCRCGDQPSKITV